MELRSKAKQGLAKMEAMGQMGNSDEATMDDSGEYDGEIDELIESFDPNDPSTFEFNEGGVVMAQQGTYVPGQTQQQFSYGFMPPQQQGFQAPGYSVMPQQTQFITDPARVAVGQGPVAVENRTYVGPNGEEIIIPFYDGKPMQGYTIPAGYKYKSPEETVAETPEISAPVVQRSENDDSGNAEAERERQQKYSQYVSTMDTLASIDPDLAKDWNNSVHKRGAGLTDIAFVGMNIYDDFKRQGMASKTVEKYAQAYGLNPEDYKNKGISGILSTYDLDRFASDVKDAQVTGRGPEATETDIYGYDYPDQPDRDVKTTVDPDTGVTRSETRDPTTGKTTGRSFIDRDGDGVKDKNERGVVTTKDGKTVMGGGNPVTTRTENQITGRGDQSDDRSDDDGGMGGVNDSVGSDPDDWSGGGEEWNKGGVIQQTERALKSSRKKK